MIARITLWDLQRAGLPASCQASAHHIVGLEPQIRHQSSLLEMFVTLGLALNPNGMSASISRLAKLPTVEILERVCLRIPCRDIVKMSDTACFWAPFRAFPSPS